MTDHTGTAYPDQDLAAIVDALAPAPPTAAELAAIAERLDAYIAQAPASAPPRRRPRRRWRARLLATAVAVGVVSVVFAATSGDRPGGDIAVPGTATAAAKVLHQAADAAARDTWTPLAPGQYHYTRALDYTPRFRAGPRGADCASAPCYDVPEPIPGAWRVTERELWADATARGAELTVDPIRYAYDSPAAREEAINTYGGAQPSHHGISRIDFTPGKAPVRRHRWARAGSTPTQPPEAGRASPYKRPVSADLLMTRNWGLRLSQLEELSADPSPKALRANLLAVLDDRGLLERTEQQPFTSEEDRELQLDHQLTRLTVELLGAAPLAPEVRSGLFEVLASLPNASHEGTQTDRLGREGTALQIVSVIDRDLPAETITHEEAVEEFTRWYEAVGDDLPSFAESGRDLVLPARREYRRHETTIIVDAESGRLLQVEEHGEAVPQTGIGVVNAKGGGPTTFEVHGPRDGAVYTGITQATLWAEVARTRGTGARSQFCLEGALC